MTNLTDENCTQKVGHHGIKVALITGASRGIGAAIAIELARLGVEPVLAVRNVGDAEHVAQQVRKFGNRCLVVECDVGNRDSVRTAVGQAIAEIGHPNILINNAGTIDPIGHIGDVDSFAWENALNTNLTGAFHMIQATLPSLLSHGGVVINISTGAARTPREGWSAYCASKAGLAMLTRSLALEYGERNIAVYGLAPGLVDTGMQGIIRASGMNEISKISKANLAPPEYSARVIAWLAVSQPADLRGKDLDIGDKNLIARAFAIVSNG